MNNFDLGRYHPSSLFSSTLAIELHSFVNTEGVAFWGVHLEMLVTILPLNIYAPTPQNGQTHSTNSSAVATNCLSVFDHFVELALKGLLLKTIA